MIPVLQVKNNNGEWIEIPAIQGEPGYTPQKGVDYWTPEEQEEILNSFREEQTEILILKPEIIQYYISTQGPLTIEAPVEIPNGWFANVAINAASLTSSGLLAETSSNGMTLSDLNEYLQIGTLYLQLMKRPNSTLIDWSLGGALPRAEAAAF